MSTMFNRLGIVAVVWSLPLVVSAPAASAQVVGTVAAAEGNAEIGHGDDFSPAEIGVTVSLGDRLRTGAAGRMRVVFRDDSVLTLGDNTTLTVDEQVFDPGAGKARSVMGLLKGRIMAVVSDYYKAAGGSYEVKTATAVAGVRGTEFLMTYDADTTLTDVVGVAGVIAVHSSVDPTGPGLLVTANEATTVARGAAPAPPRSVQPETMRQLLREIDFVGVSQRVSVNEFHALVADGVVPEPDRAPIPDVGGAAGMPGPSSATVRRDASSLVANSPAAILGGPGSGSVNVNLGRPR